MERSPQAQAGFTMIEVLVALAVAGLVLGAVFHFFGTTFQGNERAQRTTLALLVAESKLAEVGVTLPLSAGRHTGRTADGHAWVAEVRDYLPPDGIDPATLPLKAFEVEVTVTPAGRAGDAVSLATLRLRPRERHE